MPNALNYFPCTLLGANTGVGTCNIDFKNIVGAIIVPSGTTFTQANTLTPAAFVTALVVATSSVKSGRAYPLFNFGEINDGSEGPVTEKLGYGPELIVRDGSFKWEFRIIKGGFCLAKALRGFNGMDVDVFFIDGNSLVIGKRIVSSAGVISFGGIPQYQVYQAPLKINDGSKNTQYLQSFSFAGNSFDSFGGVQLAGGDLTSVQGLQNISLFSGGARVTNVSKAKGTAGCVGADLGETFGNTLAVTGLWVVKDSVSGNVIAITGVTYSGTTFTYTITVDNTDPNYVAGNPVIISLAAASVLDAAGLHYESNSFVTPN